MPDNPKTVIVGLFPYKVSDQKPKYLSRYAAVPDYHKYATEKLKNAADLIEQTFGCKCSVFVDNSPIPEVRAAATAGLGIKGDNGLLITPKYGTYVFIGEIVTDLERSCENKFQTCLHCGRCKAACPVDFQKEKCLSDVSQKKGELSEEEKNSLKENGILWGCDICAESCPLNRKTANTYISYFIEGYREIFHPDHDHKNRPYMWRKLDPILRNYNILTENQ